MKTRNILKSNGFTFMELMITISIFMIVMVFGLPTFATIRDNLALKNQSYEIVNVLRTAQHSSIVSQNNTTHGVYFATDHYVLYEGDWSSPTATVTYQLRDGIQLAGGGINFKFERLTGATQENQLTLVLNSGQQKVIKVDATGSVSIN